MAVIPFTPHQAFDPEAIEVMSSAFAGVCAHLGLAERDDGLTEVVARHVIEAATKGMRSETAIRVSVLEQFTSNPQ